MILTYFIGTTKRSRMDRRMKLTEKQNAEIKKAKCTETVHYYELAAKHGVSVSTIYRVRAK